MAMEMSSWQSGVMIRPIMSATLFSAAVKGDLAVLMKCLRLLEERSEVKVPTECSNPTPQQIETEYQTDCFGLQSTTTFGDTVLHLLVIHQHNDLALKVLQKDESLLTRPHKLQETPLHCAARTGNKDFISHVIKINCDVVVGILLETDINGDTALHVAARYGHSDIGRLLMELEPRVAHRVNNQGLTPFGISTYDSRNSMVKTMLQVDNTLAYTPFDSNGTVVVHTAASKGNTELVIHLMEEYPEIAQLRDHYGQNLFHIAAGSDKAELILSTYYHYPIRDMCRSMIDATDYEGNTPLHIAAKYGHRSIMRTIWKAYYRFKEEKRNYQDRTAFELSMTQVKSDTKYIERRIEAYTRKNGHQFTAEWFDDIMALSSKDKWERAQLIGLGSVLITTVTFAAAFTIPGGYNADNGTPVLGRKFVYKGFTIANTLSFALAFTSLFTLTSSALVDPDFADLQNATETFTAAACCMVVAFALGSYVMLAPVSLVIAIMVLSLTLPLGLPFMPLVIELYRYICKHIYLKIFGPFNVMLKHKLWRRFSC